jgi:hypothetical protein
MNHKTWCNDKLVLSTVTIHRFFLRVKKNSHTEDAWKNRTWYIGFVFESDNVIILELENSRQKRRSNSRINSLIKKKLHQL